MKKEMIKAIRMVNGFNPDLRVKLPYKTNDYTAQQEKIVRFLMNQLLDIYGFGIYDRLGIKINPRPGRDAEDFQKLLDFVNKESRAVLLGETEE